MKADAEAHAGEDQKRKELVEAKNIAEQLIYTAEKAVKDNGEKAGEEVVAEVNEKIAALKTAREGDDVAAITAASEALSASISKIGEAMAKQQGDAEPPADAPDQSTGPTKDADFTE